MKDTWIDNHQIVDGYRIGLSFNKKLTFTFYDIEELGTMMGVLHTVPVAAVGGLTYIQQFCSFA